MQSSNTSRACWNCCSTVSRLVALCVGIWHYSALSLVYSQTILHPPINISNRAAMKVLHRCSILESINIKAILVHLRSFSNKIGPVPLVSQFPSARQRIPVVTLQNTLCQRAPPRCWTSSLVTRLYHVSDILFAIHTLA